MLNRWARMWHRVLSCESGQGMVEYALILVLVAIVVIGVLGIMGTKISDAFNDIVTGLGG